MNLRPSGYEPDELPDCSTPRRGGKDTTVHRRFSRAGYPAEMRWPRRRRLLSVATVSAEIVPLTPRIERVLVTLAVHAAQLDGRLERLERRLDETVEAALDGRDQLRMRVTERQRARSGEEVDEHVAVRIDYV